MKFATRLNSFLKKQGQTLETALAQLGTIEGISHVDLNYPEHFFNHSHDEIRILLQKNALLLNGLGIRFDSMFVKGEFTNPNPELAEWAEKICLEAVDICRKLGGKVVTVWQAYDGYDYPFQIDYPLAWKKMVEALRSIADKAAPDILISVEYKPFQPRAFSLVPNFSTTMLLLEEVDRDNIGITLDFCHMLMAGDNPGTALAMAASKNRLYGIHLNDGYRLNDDGLMVGSVHLPQTIEFLYYALKYGYQHAVFFDTFPIREAPDLECIQNVQTVERLMAAIQRIGIDRIEQMIGKQSGLTCMKIIHEIML